jgi:uncharacterized protein YggT (Ycf19 family)
MEFDLVGFLFILLRIVEFLIFASVIVSWVRPNPESRLVQGLQNATEPIYRPFRAITRHIPGPLDLAPMLALLAIELTKSLLVRVLMS